MRAYRTDFRLWDWSSSRKTGTIHLDLPPQTHITSGRFVNELHETNVVLAVLSKREIWLPLTEDTGDIHVFAGPSEDPSKMQPISSFLALSMTDHPVDIRSESQRRLKSTWWRHSGLLGVGGPASNINIWDCPAEKRVRVSDAVERSR
jgi:regulator-associated protein of mTOR